MRSALYIYDLVKATQWKGKSGKDAIKDIRRLKKLLNVNGDQIVLEGLWVRLRQAIHEFSFPGTIGPKVFSN